MKWNRLLRSAAACVALVYAGCDDKPICGGDPCLPPLDPIVRITPDTLNLLVGTSATLTASITNDTIGTLSGVTWSSTLPEVATVNNAGVVTGVASGFATILARSKFRAARVASAAIVVLAPASECMMFVAPSSAVLGAVGATVQLVVNPCVGPVTWKSSDPAVATVSTTGEVRPLKNGIATITATSNTDARVSATSRITVTLTS